MPRGATKSRKPELPVLSQSEVENLRGKIADEEAHKRQATGVPLDAGEAHMPATEAVELDLEAIEARIRRNKRAIATLGPEAHRLTGAQRQTAEKEYKDLCEWLGKRMLTLSEMGAYPSVSDEIKRAHYDGAVRHAMDKDGEHSPLFIERAHRAKRLARILWPEDLEMANLERLRPKGDKSGRHFDA